MPILCYSDVHFQFINIPKCASTSILSAMFKLHDLSVEEVHKAAGKYRTEYRENGPPAFAVVRHPWRRFVSTWQNKVHTPHRPDTALLRMGAPLGGTIYDFAQWCLSKPDVFKQEMHLIPQVDRIPGGGKVKLLPQEDLLWAWDHIGAAPVYGNLEWRNDSDPAENVRTTLRPAIENIYRRDFQIWNEAIKTYTGDSDDD